MSTNLKYFSKYIRKKIIETAYYAGSSSAHLGGALSSVEILTTLFFKIMNYNKENFLLKDRDRFILSKGHGCLVYYSALAEAGIINEDLLKNFEKPESSLLGHPVKNEKLGIEFSNGSLGMGLSIGIGVAIASKKKNFSNKVYVLLGDGECNEGSVWEAAMSSVHFKLDNLVVTIDRNNFQQTGASKDIMNYNDLKKMWESFGYYTLEVDGHNFDELLKAYNDNSEKSKPKIVIANTIKGKGISFAENDNNWHHAVLTKNLYDKAMEELKNET